VSTAERGIGLADGVALTCGTVREGGEAADAVGGRVGVRLVDQVSRSDPLRK
jgi:hypothetical protein